MFRRHWWPAVATMTRLVGDLALAEESVQDACAVAMERWPVEGVPTHPTGWLVGVARHKAIDRIRRESRRATKELAGMQNLDGATPFDDAADDDLISLVFLCCHPALDESVRVPLTLRAVCGRPVSEIAALYLVSETAMAKRLVRARRKIRESGISFHLSPERRADRLDDVMQVLYLMFSEGHRPRHGPDPIDAMLCDQAIELARRLAELMPVEPEVLGLLALLLFTDGRRAARLDDAGDVVILEEQDRSRWDAAQIAEGERQLEAALRLGRPGRFQVWAAIAACHATAPTADDTDWMQIAALYQELLRYEPTGVVEANRAVAVAMAEGPMAGIVILESLLGNAQLAAWPAIHLARADLYRRSGDTESALMAYRDALALEPPPGERRFIARRLEELATDR